MDDKILQIEIYVRRVAKKLNKKYAGAVSDEKIEMVVQMFSDSTESMKQIKKHINKLAKEVELNHKKMLHRNAKTKNKYIDQLAEKNETKSYDEIEKVIKIVKGLSDKNKMKLYISGGVVPYLLLDKFSNRLHSDIDIVCDLKDMKKIREIFIKEGYYKYDFDSINYAPDGIDYGFEMIIRGVQVGIYPFTYKNKELTQYTYNAHLRFCKIKKFHLEGLSDYVCSYKSKNRMQYYTMSLEYIKLSKMHANRAKDKEDIAAIDELNNIRDSVYERLEMFKEVQNASVEDLEYDQKHELDLKTEKVKNFISIENKGKKIQKINLKKIKNKSKKVKKM